MRVDRGLFLSLPFASPSPCDLLGERKHLEMFRIVSLKVESIGGYGEDTKDVTNSCHSVGSF